MEFSKIVILYLSSIVVFTAVDLAWLGIFAKNFYKTQIGYLMRTDIIWWAAILFYLLFIVGILYYAVLPAHAAGDWTKALLYGALFGFFTYMTYELTNYSVVRDWPLTIVFIDIAWGTALAGIVSTIGFFIARFLS